MAHFPSEMLSFLADLAQNNDRDWFKAHKKRYEAQLKQPALDFIEAFAEPLAELSPHFQAIPKAQGGSLFRIYRDTRFSADKTPYKTHTGMHFRHRQASRDVHAPGFYLHIQPGASGAGMGMWRPDNKVLARVRQAMSADVEGWLSMHQALAQAGLAMMRDDALKRVPRGYDKDHPLADDLRLKSIAVWRDLSDEEVCAPGFDQQLAAVFADGVPLVRFLCETLDLEY